MRLNSIHRQTILNRAMKAQSMVAATTTLAHRGDVLAKEVYEFVFSDRTRTSAAHVGDKWVSVRTAFKINVAGATIVLHFAEPTPLPSDNYGCCAVVTAGGMADRIMAYASDVDQDKKDRERAKAAIYAMLEACPTVETLASVWPEGQQFYADLEIRKPDLPTVIGTDINKMLGVA